MDREKAAALLHRLHAAQNRFYSGGDTDALLEVLAPDITWRIPGDNAIAGDYHGIDEVIGYFRKRRELADGSFRIHIRDVLSGASEWITAIADGSALIGGHERTWSTMGLYQVRVDRIASCRLLPFDTAEFDAIWSSRPSDPVSVCRIPVLPGSDVVLAVPSASRNCSTSLRGFGPPRYARTS